MHARAQHASPDEAVRDHGFTLIELVVAMVILASVSVAIIGVIIGTQAAGVSNRDRVAASNLASRELELVRQQFAATTAGPLAVAAAGLVTNPHPLPNGTAGQPLVVDGTPYTVTRSAQWNLTGTGSSACEGGSLVAYPSLGVTVTVTWPNMGSAKPVTTSTAMAPEKDVGIPTSSSFIAAKVVDQAANPIAGVAMSAIGPATATGATDSTGCAVLQVAPATAGSTYTVKVADASYVDISGTSNPSKTTGTLKPGTLYSGATFTIAKPGSVTVHLVRSDGGSLTNAQVNGSTISLVASQYAGPSGVTTRTATAVDTTFTNLWPTNYGAFFGTVPPAGGYSAQNLQPGGSLTLDVPFEMASVPVEQLPTGTTQVIAVPAGTPATCPTGVGVSATTSGTDATLTALPGTYDLYLDGSTFACSPGPTGVTFTSGDTDPVEWATSTLRIQGAPGATIWALNKAKSALGSLSTCPGSAYASLAVNIDGARTGAVSLPAGSWFVWQTNGTANGTCMSYPDQISPLALSYGTATSKTWALSATTLSVTGVSSGLYLAITTTPPTTCSKTTFTPTPTLGSTKATSSNATLSISAPRANPSTIYHAYIWDQTKTTGACRDIGTFTVSATTGSTLTKSQSAPSSNNVGP